MLNVDGRVLFQIGTFATYIRRSVATSFWLLINFLALWSIMGARIPCSTSSSSITISFTYSSVFYRYYRAPTPVSLPVSQPNGVLRFPPRELRPLPPSESGLDDAKDSFLALDACWTVSRKVIDTRKGAVRPCTSGKPKT
jgi:hypothetical protein